MSERIPGPLGDDGGWFRTKSEFVHICVDCPKPIPPGFVYTRDGQYRHVTCQGKARSETMSTAEKKELLHRLFDLLDEEESDDE